MAQVARGFSWILATLLATLLAASIQAQDGKSGAAKAEPAVADYARQLGDANKVVRREAAYQLSRMGAGAREAVPELIKALGDSEQQVWFGAVVALANIGPEAADAIPVLLRGITRSGQREARQVWYRSSYALSRIGPKAVPALMEGLKSEDALARAGCAQALGWMGKAALDSMPRLAPLLEDGNADVRRLSAEALARFGTNAVSHLVPLITHSNEVVRASSAYALARLGVAGGGVAPAVFEQLKVEQDADARAAQYGCLTGFQFRQPEYLKMALEQMSDQDLRIRHAAAEAVVAYGDGPAATVPALGMMLDGADPSRKERAALVLSRLGPAAAPVSASLVREAQRDQGTNSAFRQALTAIGGAAVPAVSHAAGGEPLDRLNPDHWTVQCLAGMGPLELPRFNPLLKSESPAIQLLGLEVLHLLGPEAAGSQPLIEPLLAREIPRLRARALAALLAVVRHPETLVTHIDRAFKDADASVRTEAAAAVTQLGTAVKPMIPTLIHALGDPDLGVQVNAARALGALGSDAQSAASGLTERLSEAKGPLRLALVEALGQMGTAAAAALPELVHSLDEDSLELRVMSLQTLGSIGSKAASAIPKITALCTNAAAPVRAAAVGAVGKIDDRPEAVLAVLSGAIADPEGAVRRAAAEGLGRLGEKARDHAPGLFGMLDKPEERAVALDNLRRIRSQSVPHYVEALGNSDPAVRVFACESLGSMGKSASEAVPALKTALNDRYDFVRRQARQALRSIGDAEAGN